MTDFEYVCIWTCSVFILLKEYWWIGYRGPAPKFCFGSFKDILFWFLWEHSDNGIGRTSAVHRGDFLGLKTSMRRLRFCSVMSGSVCNSLIFGPRWVYMSILTLWFSFWEFCSHFDYTFLGAYAWEAYWVWDYVYIHTMLDIYIYIY